MNKQQKSRSHGHNCHSMTGDYAMQSTSAVTSPPDNGSLSPYAKSAWSSHTVTAAPTFNHSASASFSSSNGPSYNRLMGSLVREEGHIYSIVVSGELLYTGSDSKYIRVWKNQREFSGFKANSGLVKSIVIAGEKIFTGHQDGKIRVWKISLKNPTIHKRVGTLPTLRAFIKSSIKPSNYVEIGRRRTRNVVWIRHYDAISSLSLSEDNNYLYSASWDKTVKVWRASNFKCLESITAHEDAVNAVITGFNGLVFTGSADGTIKVWRREVQGKGTKHFFTQSLLKQECAVTTLDVDPTAMMVYCGSSDGTVNFWHKEDFGNPGGSLKGHKLAVLCLATAGKLVLSGSADMNICVWKRGDVNENGGNTIRKISHTCLSVLTGHNGPVKCLAVEEDKEIIPSQGTWILYSGSSDKSIKIWRISEHAIPEVNVSTNKRNTQVV